MALNQRHPLLLQPEDIGFAVGLRKLDWKIAMSETGQDTSHSQTGRVP
jgi:hypothetical protein